MISVRLEPRTPPLSWEAFTSAAPPFAIAIDGYVADGPRYEDAGPRLNLNHHEHVSRLETRATCAQALMAVRQGLFERFVNTLGNPEAVIFANDCDEDVCLTVFILRNSCHANHAINPMLNRLVSMEDVLDTTGGSYSFPTDIRSMHELNWVFAPYRRFRIAGGLDRKDPAEYIDVVDSVGQRIMLHICGRGEVMELDVSYRIIARETGWVMVNETGMNARLGLFRDGHRAFIAVRTIGNDRYVYTVGRQSVFIRFPVDKILEELDRAENNPLDHWGGGNLIGGSPRVHGSRLSPPEVTRIVAEVLRAHYPVTA